MELNIPIKEEDKYLVVITFLSAIKPFSELRKRELEVYSELIRYWNEYKSLSYDKRNKLIFNYDARLEIAEKFNTTVDNVYQITTTIRKKGLIDENGVVPKYAELIKVDDNCLKINLIPS